MWRLSLDGDYNTMHHSGPPRGQETEAPVVAVTANNRAVVVVAYSNEVCVI